MKKEIVRIAIISHNAEICEKLKYAFIQESKNFNVKIDVTTKIEDISKISSLNILIVIVDNELEENIRENITILKNKVNRVILIDKNNLSKEFKTNKNIKIIPQTNDTRVIAFSILYEYNQKFIKKHEMQILKEQNNRLKKSMKKFNINNELVPKLSENIDKILMEGLSHNSEGYEDLKIMITFCIINEIDIDEQEHYEYIYEAISKIQNKRVYDIQVNIRNTLTLIRNRRKKLKIQKLLKQLKYNLAVENVILISKEIKKQIK